MRRVLPLFLALASACGGLNVQLGGAPSEEPAGGAKVKDTVRAAREEAAIQSAIQLVESRKAGYSISSADLLEISVYQETDLDRKVRVSPEGVITLPLAGEVKVAGLSVPEAERALIARFKRYIVDPHVSVFIKEYGNKQVYVLGEVAKPGSYAIPTEAPLSALEAVTLAGGFTQFAAPDRTRVIRSKQGHQESIVVEMSAITKRGDKSKDVSLQPNDVVFVPESFF